MPYYFYIWTDEIVDYIDRHGVTPEEFEAVVSDPDEVEKSHSSDRFVAFGNIDGRPLACVYELTDDYVLPVTAYEVQ